jgi:hypothetical protein
MDPPALWAVGSMAFAILVAFLSPSLEDPVFPPLLFLIIGIAWWFGAARRGGTIGADAGWIAHPGPALAGGSDLSTRVPAGPVTRASVRPVSPGPAPSYGPGAASGGASADTTAILPALRPSQPDDEGEPATQTLLGEMHGSPGDSEA